MVLKYVYPNKMYKKTWEMSRDTRMGRSSFRLISECEIERRNERNNWLAFYERERERHTEKHAHAARLTTVARSVVTAFGLIFFRLPPFQQGTSFQLLLSRDWILWYLIVPSVTQLRIFTRFMIMTEVIFDYEVINISEDVCLASLAGRTGTFVSGDTIMSGKASGESVAK